MNRNEPLNRGKKKNIDSENIQAQKTGIIGSKQRKSERERETQISEYRGIQRTEKETKMNNQRDGNKERRLWNSEVT